MQALIDFLSGALTFSYLLAAFYFVNFWRRASERLFLNFAIAFGLLAINQLILAGLGDERSTYAYVLRLCAFALILVGIVDKNLFGRKR